MWTTRLFNQLFPALSPSVWKYRNSLYKAHSDRKRLTFLKDYLDEHVLPKSLLPFRLRHLSGFPFDDFAALILKKHIQKTKVCHNKYFKTLSHSKYNFNIHIPESWKNTLWDDIYPNLRYKLNILDLKLKNKLNFLIKNFAWSKVSCSDTVQNLSSITLDTTATTALSYWINFSIDRRPSSLTIARAFRQLENQLNVNNNNIDIAKGIVYKEMFPPPY